MESRELIFYSKQRSYFILLLLIFLSIEEKYLKSKSTHWRVTTQKTDFKNYRKNAFYEENDFLCDLRLKSNILKSF